MAETVVFFLFFESKAGALIDPAGGMQDVVRPKRQFAISGVTGKGNALGNEHAADAQPAGRRLDKQQTQLSGSFRLLDEKDAANSFAAAFRDPATFALGIEMH